MKLEEEELFHLISNEEDSDWENSKGFYVSHDSYPTAFCGVETEGRWFAVKYYYISTLPNGWWEATVGDVMWCPNCVASEAFKLALLAHIMEVGK